MSSADAEAPSRALMPPHVVLRDLLDETSAAALVDYAASRESEFRPTGVGPHAVDTSIRVSLGLRDLGDFRRILEAEVLGRLTELITSLRMPPFEASRFETQLVAHGDGAFYKRHIDTQTAGQYERAGEIRVLSGVYYVFARPKAFSGGALRLHAIGGSAPSFVDIEPEHNTLVAFPSWAPHEVTPVSCPSGRFGDSRFAVNCWAHRRKARGAD
jgi:Rps23 Pro-64 3,4-dihydroxylase Tpa1-like proline 4-hydroxylase